MDIPADISRLVALRRFGLEYCELEALPPCVQALPQLTALSLEGNYIDELPEGTYLTGEGWILNTGCTGGRLAFLL